jgi:SAM-dependent methyltransferase
MIHEHGGPKRGDGMTSPHDDARTPAWLESAVESSATTLTAQMNKVLGYMKGVHATHLIQLGLDLGLFDAIGASGASMPSILAAATGMHPPYVRVWCEAACALELLDYKPSAGYRLAPFMDQILAEPGGTFSLRGFPELHLTLADDYSRYPELFESGNTYTYGDHGDAFVAKVASALDVLPRMFLNAVLPDLPVLAQKLNSGARVLDVGCGAGAAIVEFAERFPAVRCLGIDIEPASIQMANERIAAAGLGTRVTTRLLAAGPWPDDLIDGSFDLVMSYLVLHELDPGLKVSVLADSVRALAPDGLLLLFDERYPSEPEELRDATQIFAVMAQWYELTWGNQLNTREEIVAMLADEGMKVVRETALSRFHIVVAARTG